MRALLPIARRPTLWVESGVALAWLLLVLGSLPSSGSASAGGSRGASGQFWICMTDPAALGGGHAGHLDLAGGPASLATSLPMPALMAVAMMVPPAMPAIWHVAGNSFYWRRRRAVVEFVAVFVTVWAAYNVVVLGALDSSGVASSPFAAVAALALAALWQLTPAKRRALQSCHRTSPLPPRGWRATAGTAEFGLRQGMACLGSCWAMMLTMAFVALPGLVWMAALTALITAERLSLRPRRASRRVGAALAVATTLAAALALV